MLDALFSAVFFPRHADFIDKCCLFFIYIILEWVAKATGFRMILITVHSLTNECLHLRDLNCISSLLSEMEHQHVTVCSTQFNV